MASRTTRPAHTGIFARIRGFRLRDALIAVFLVLGVWTLLPPRQQEFRNIDTPGRAVVCFGDSLHPNAAGFFSAQGRGRPLAVAPEDMLPTASIAQTR